MKKHIKIALAAAAVLILTSIGLYLFLQPLSLEVVRIQPDVAQIRLTENGFVESSEDYQLYADVSGRILQRYFRKGDRVAAGDLILELDSSAAEAERWSRQHLIASYQAQMQSAIVSDSQQKQDYRASIVRLQEELNSIEAQRGNAEARRAEAPSVEEQIRLLDISLEQQQMQIDFAAAQAKRLQRLFEAGVQAHRDVEQAEQELLLLQNGLASLQEQRQARLDDQEKALNEGRKIVLGEESDTAYYDALTQSVIGQIYAFEARLGADSLQPTLDYYRALIGSEQAAIEAIDTGKYRLYAPFDAIISEFPAEKQSSLSALSPALSLRPLDASAELRVVTYVSTRDIDKLAIGQQVELIRKLRDQDLHLSGQICAIEERAEVMLSALGIEERRVKVSIRPDANESGMIGEHADEAAKPSDPLPLCEGYDVEVRFTLEEQENKLLVPSSAIFKHEEQDYVFVVQDQKAERRPVTTGLKTSNRTVLESGVSAEELVVVDPNQDGLREGSRLEAIIR